MIPKVKTWVVTVESGRKYEISAPTRYLARLNFRHEAGYTPIKSIGVRRVKRTKGEF